MYSCEQPKLDILGNMRLVFTKNSQLPITSLKFVNSRKQIALITVRFHTKQTVLLFSLARFPRPTCKEIDTINNKLVIRRGIRNHLINEVYQIVFVGRALRNSGWMYYVLIKKQSGCLSIPNNRVL